MMQGDSYGLAIEIKNVDDSAITPNDVEDIEVTIGHLRKTYKDGDVVFKDEMWIFPLTQVETFKFPASCVKAQIRVVWPGGNVEGVSLGRINVIESMSKEVL